MYILEDTVLPIPEKLKNIRKYLGLKQEDLTDGKISRSLISYIENGKVKLTKTVAETIAECISKTLKNKGMELKIDADYLMGDENKQASIAIAKYLNKLIKGVDERDLSLVEEVIKRERIWSKWNVPDKQAMIYELIGDFYYDNMKFRDSYINYIKSHECNIKNDNEFKSAEVVTKIARCSLLLKDYQESIELNKHALSILEKSNIESQDLHKRCLFNMAIAYKELGYEERTIEYLNEIESSGYALTDGEYIDIFTLRGNSFLAKKDYNKAEKNYKKAIELAEKDSDGERLSLAYINISALYNEMGKIEESIKYGKKGLNIKAKINTIMRDETLLAIGKKYKILKEYDLAEKYLLRAIKETDYTGNTDVKMKTYTELLCIYRDTKEHYLAMRLIDEVQDLYRNAKIHNNIKEIREMERFFIKSIDYFIDKDINKSKELLNILIEKGDEYEN